MSGEAGRIPASEEEEREDEEDEMEAQRYGEDGGDPFWRKQKKRVMRGKGEQRDLRTFRRLVSSIFSPLLRTFTFFRRGTIGV